MYVHELKHPCTPIQNGHPVSNPAFALHAIEIHSNNRDPSGLYGTKGAPFGPTRDVLLSDRHVFR